MASPTEEDIDRKRTEVEELRARAAQSDNERAATTAERTRKSQAKRLEREKARLHAKLARNERATKGASSKDSAPSGTPSTPPPNDPPTTRTTGDDKKE